MMLSTYRQLTYFEYVKIGKLSQAIKSSMNSDRTYIIIDKIVSLSWSIALFSMPSYLSLSCSLWYSSAIILDITILGSGNETMERKKHG